MRRYSKTLIIIVVLVILAGLILGFQNIKIGNFKRGGDTLLGLNLGLDLQGGSHLVYQAVDSVTKEPVTPDKVQMEALKRAIERRINASGLGEPVIQILGEDRLLIQLPSVRDPDRAKSIIGETAQLVFKHRMLDVPRELLEITSADIVGASVGRLSPEDLAVSGAATSTPAELPIVIFVDFTEEGATKFAVVQERLQNSYQEAFIAAQQGGLLRPNRLDVSVEGTQPLRFEVTALSLGRIGTSTRFAMGLPRVIAGQEVTDVTSTQALVGANPRLSFTEIQGKVDEDIREGSLTGDDLARAFASQHTQSGAPIVNIEFKPRGARIFGELTTRIAGSPSDQIAIFLDEEELISPVVQTPITSGAAIIQGKDFTVERVRDIALLLESGRLPIPIKLAQEKSVDAILGADSLAKSVVAGLIGLGVVILFMVLYYRASGLIASLALLLYTGFILAIFKVLPITLTLSGVAALVMSIGMAVDANVLIFERMKEELWAGRTLLSAINIGFNRAWSAIRDSNVSTLITCAILYWFANQLGITIVQGFAITLAIGVLVSMFTAITVSRTLLRFVATPAMARRLGLFVPYGGTQLPQVQRQAPVDGIERS